ncbi:queuine tRNA-ribosyltransferase accessory subunit 2 [Anabrus simplex]|uniref:queuine tRNA-ribosyltransferase accessory subunit 2 n=1 Tax=Anabrus simplex TaxID=316456 RepID=UPI0035A2DDC3
MRFIIKSAANCAGRVGRICDMDRLPDLVLETPLIMMYTKGGSIPHITREVLQMITKESLAIQVPISTVMQSEEVVSEFKTGLGTFIGLSDNLIYCTVQDPVVPTPQGFDELNMVAIFNRAGKHLIDADKYMDIMEAFKPDMYQVLCDGNTNKKSSKKRVQKAAGRTSLFFKKCMERHTNSKILQNKAVLGVVEGGYSDFTRKACAKEISQSPVSGFVIDGLHCNGPEVENLSFEDVKTVIENTLKYLPEDKFRVVQGCWNPEVVLDLVELGIDVFDSSYPFVVSERGSALVFPNHICGKEMNEISTIADRESNRENLVKLFGNSTKSSSGESGDTSLKNEGVDSMLAPHSKYEISLRDKKYFDDFQPLCASCSCLTCKKHTRSYIHHLLITKELLGSVLLMIHNLHYYMEYFKNIRTALQENLWSNFRHCVSGACDKR